MIVFVETIIFCFIYNLCNINTQIYENMEKQELMIFFTFIIGFILIVFVLFHTKKNIKRRRQREIKTKIETVVKSKPIEKKIVIDNSDIKYYLEQNQNISTPLILETYGNSVMNNTIDNGFPTHNLFDNNEINILQDIRNYDLIDEIYTRADLIGNNQNGAENIRNTIVENYERNIVQNLLNRPDLQNVHDSVVQNTIKHKFKNIEEKTQEQTENEKDIIKEIIERSKQSSPKYAKISGILAQIASRSSPVYNLNSNEIEVLKKTWINAPEQQKDQILNELLDCEENNRLVCPTGVVSRIINSDVVLAPEKASKTIENLREEMMNTAARVRNELEDKDEFQNKPDNEQSEIFKDTLVKKYEENYKDVIDMDIIKGEYEKWINDI